MLVGFHKIKNIDFYYNKFGRLPQILLLEEISDSVIPKNDTEYLLLIFSKKGIKKIVNDLEKIKDKKIIENIISLLQLNPTEALRIMDAVEEIEVKYDPDVIRRLIGHIGIKETIDAVGIKAVIDTVGIKSVIDAVGLGTIFTNLDADEVYQILKSEYKSGKLTKSELEHVLRELDILTKKMHNLLREF